MEMMKRSDRVFADGALDIVRGVAVRRPGEPIDPFLKAVKAEEKGRGKRPIYATSTPSLFQASNDYCRPKTLASTG